MITPNPAETVTATPAPTKTPTPPPLDMADAEIAYLDIEHYLWVMNADGTAHRQLTQSGAVRSPTWSPDGTLLAYAAVPIPPGATGDIETMEHMLDGRAIYVVDPADGESRALTDPGEAVDGWPQWSADDTHLLYTRQHDGYTDVRVVGLAAHTGLLSRPVVHSSYRTSEHPHNRQLSS